MKVFISWSGPLSQKLAEILRQWLPSVIQAVKPYYSTDDTSKGLRWSTEIARQLEESQVGLICLTRDNLAAPWLMFEAGALGKQLDSSRVCPILFDVGTSDVEFPLAQFQMAKFEKGEMRRVLRTINEALGQTPGETALDTQLLDAAFEKWWPELEQEVGAALQVARAGAGAAARPERDTRDILDEILSLSRALAMNGSSLVQQLSFIRSKDPARISTHKEGGWEPLPILGQFQDPESGFYYTVTGPHPFMGEIIGEYRDDYEVRFVNIPSH